MSGQPAFVFPAMGTMISVRSARPLNEQARAAVRRPFADLEARFSLYRPDSEASRVAAGTLRVGDAGAEFRRTYDRAVGWRVRTRGAFSPRRPNGSVDLNGIVKAIAIQRARAVLDSANVADWCLNAGGDVLVGGGRQGDGRTWVVGVVDPDDRTALIARYAAAAPMRAVATSGYAERGEHVWRSAGMDFQQVSVAAVDIVTADVLATAILSGGWPVLESVQRMYRIDVLAVGTEHTMWASGGFRTDSR